MSTPSSTPRFQNQELPARAATGCLFLLIELLLIAAAVWCVAAAVQGHHVRLVFAAIGSFVLAMVLAGGFFTLQPNEAAVLILFGAYKGTVRNSGFFFTNPFNKKLQSAGRVVANPRRIP